MLAYLGLESNHPDMIATELPMKLDSVIISTDTQKVNLVWRSMIISDYRPKEATLKMIDREAQNKLSEQYYTQVIKIARPYDTH